VSRPSPELVADLAARILAAPPSAGPVRLVCIDGPSGAGKSTLARDLAGALASSPSWSGAASGPPVVHGDDVYEGWDVVAGASGPLEAFSALGQRLVVGLVDPWLRGEPGSVDVWAWVSSRWAGARAVPAAPVVVLEGVGLAGPALRPHAALTVWIDADPALRSERVEARDGLDVAPHMPRWRAWESAWHTHDATASHCDVRLRT
jgi:energy-coupling factor transporter ATP-binding protein EcfA2